MASPRIVFMGTPEFAAYSLKSLVESGFDVCAVVTTADKPAGRGQKLKECDVKIEAMKHNLDILQPISLKDEEFLERLRSYHADLFVVVAFRMLPEMVWRMPPMGTVNLHGSLLPDYRGAAPIQWSVINGDKFTGVTTFFIEKEIDTGRIIAQSRLEIGDDEETGSLHDRMMVEGADLLCRTVKAIGEGTAQSIAQDSVDNSLRRPAPKIFKSDCLIDWNKSSREIYNLIRGLSPYPAAWTYLDTEKGRISAKVFKSAVIDSTSSEEPGSVHSDGKSYIHICTSDSRISILELQPEGKKRMAVADFLRGTKLTF